jgi:putative transposase
MSKKRKVYSAEFKSKLVLEVLEGEFTLNEIASKYEILPANLKNWKKQFIANMSLAFDKSAVVKEYKEEIVLLQKNSDALAKKVGTLTIEKEWLEGKLVSLDLSIKKEMIDSQANNKVSLNRQLELLSVSKTAYYYEPVEVFAKDEDRIILNRIDEIYTKFPYYGHRRVHQLLLKEGFVIGRKMVQKAMKFMGIKALYPKPRTTIANSEHKKYPYLLNEFKNDNNQVVIEEVNQVWSTDITYIKLEKGFAYLSAIIDWNTKKILSWKLSNLMDVSLTTSVLKDALARYPKPDIVNTDQGSQYTAFEHIDILVKNNISISMDAKGRSIDNIVIERFWRSLKYEDVYLQNYNTIKEARIGIGKYIELYNTERLHSALDYSTPNEAYFSGVNNLEVDEIYMLPKVS